MKYARQHQKKARAVIERELCAHEDRFTRDSVLVAIGNVFVRHIEIQRG